MSRHVVCVCCRLAVVHAVFVAGCGRRAGPSPVESPGNAEKGETPRLTVSEKVCIPATCIRFMRVSLDGEKRSGLYAVRYLKGLGPDYPTEFKKAADGKAEPLVAGKERVALVGRFPGQVTMVDYFVAEDASVQGNQISVPARFVESTDPTGARAANAYVVVEFPSLPAGRYRARIEVTQYTKDRFGDKASIQPLPPDRPSRFEPLECAFEVTGGPPTEVLPVEWGEVVQSLQLSLRADRLACRPGESVGLTFALRLAPRTSSVRVTDHPDLLTLTMDGPKGKRERVIYEWDSKVLRVRDWPRLGTRSGALPGREAVLDFAGDGRPTYVRLPEAGVYRLQAAYSVDVEGVNARACWTPSAWEGGSVRSNVLTLTVNGEVKAARTVR